MASIERPRQSSKSLLDLKEVAARLRMHYDTARDLVIDGKLRAARIGGRWRVRESDLEAFIESSVFQTPRTFSGPNHDQNPPVLTFDRRSQKAPEARKHEWRKRFER